MLTLVHEKELPERRGKGQKDSSCWCFYSRGCIRRFRGACGATPRGPLPLPPPSHPVRRLLPTSRVFTDRRTNKATNLCEHNGYVCTTINAWHSASLPRLRNSGQFVNLVCSSFLTSVPNLWRIAGQPITLRDAFLTVPSSAPRTTLCISPFGVDNVHLMHIVSPHAVSHLRLTS